MVTNHSVALWAIAYIGPYYADPPAALADWWAQHTLDDFAPTTTTTVAAAGGRCGSQICPRLSDRLESASESGECQGRCTSLPGEGIDSDACGIDEGDHLLVPDGPLLELSG